MTFPRMPYPMPSRRSLVVLLSLLAALGPCTVDLYLPALPLLQADLGASAALVQLTLTATTVGLAVGQLAIGPWSDSVGRRLPLLIATAVHLVASLGAAASSSIGWLLVFRLLQGAGAAGSGVVAMAIVRDVFHGHAFVRVLARLALVTGVAPIVAPFLGSLLMRLGDWRGIFISVAVYAALVLLIVMFFLGESLPVEGHTQSEVGSAVSRYRRVLADPSFVGIALIGGLIVSGVFTQMTSSSLVFQTIYGLSPQGYGLVSALNAIGFVVGTQTAARIVRHMAPEAVLRYSLPALALAGFAVIPAGALGVGGVSVTIFLFMLAAGMSIPSLQVVGLGRQARHAGTAAALLGAANFGLAGLLSPVAGLIGTASVAPMGAVMGVAATVALAILYALVMPPLRESDAR